MIYGCGCINGIYMSMNSHLLVSTTSARNKAIDISTECLHGVFAMKIKSRILPLSFAITLTMVAGQAHADVMVHMFQWKFNDIANECENVLGPKGFGSIQITPPAEHVNKPDVWWSVYQPINLANFNSYGGSEAELRSMITRCNKAGVKSMPMPSSIIGHPITVVARELAAPLGPLLIILDLVAMIYMLNAVSAVMATVTKCKIAASTVCRISILARIMCKTKWPPI